MGNRGVTLLEMMITLVILLVLASVAMPLSTHTAKRAQELALRQKLREMRIAIDDFRRDWSRDGNLLIGPLCLKNKTTCKEHTGVTGYPKTLKTLLGVELSGSDSTIREVKAVRRYLRRIPIDPVTGSSEWGLRCYQDPPETDGWCGEDVFDVFSTSQDQAMDQSKYRVW